MPKYDFKCNTCGIVQELLLTVDESASVPACSICGNFMTRIYTPPAVHFNGPGFYKTGG